MVIFMGFTPLARAQESPGCDPFTVSIRLTDGISRAQHDLAQAKSLTTVLDQLIQAIQTLRDTCAGEGSPESTTEAEASLSFSGDKDTVIGPVDIPAGTYRATATTAGYIIVHISALSGECGAGTRGSSDRLFSNSEGEATNGAESILISKACNALLEVSNITAPWTLEFEKLG